MSEVPPGWYDDPVNPSGELVWWDGIRWTEYRKPREQNYPQPPTLPNPPLAAPSAATAPRRSRAVMGAAIGVSALVVAAVAFSALRLAGSFAEPDLPFDVPTEGNPTATTVTADGVELVLPAGWAEVPTDPGDLAELVEAAGDIDPEMAEAMKQMAALPGLELSMLAFHPGFVENGIAENANLLVIPGPGVTPQKLSGNYLNGLQAVGATEITDEVVSIAGGKALRIEYRIKAAYGLQYVLPSANSVAILSITGGSASAVNGASTIGKSMHFAGE